MRSATIPATLRSAHWQSHTRPGRRTSSWWGSTTAVARSSSIRSSAARSSPWSSASGRGLERLDPRRHGLRALSRPLCIGGAPCPQRGGSAGRAGDGRRLRVARPARPGGRLRADHLLRPRALARAALVRRGTRVRALPGTVVVTAATIAVDALLGLAVGVALLSSIGVLAMRDPYQRLHFITPPASLSA